MDIVSKKKRSEMMSKIRSKNTKPEIYVRKILHKLGYRFRIHKKTLPGKPDIYIKKLNLVIFINGCFWHGQDCQKGRVPKTNTEFWTEKIGRNKVLDLNKKERYDQINMNILTIWECELKSSEDKVELIKSKLILYEN